MKTLLLLVFIKSVLCGLDHERRAVINKRLLEALQKDYSKSTPPPPIGNSTDAGVDVKVQLLYTHIEVDEAKQKVVYYGYMPMKWQDTRLAWEPKKYEGIEEVYMEQHTMIWHPTLSILNSAGGLSGNYYGSYTYPARITSKGFVSSHSSVTVETRCDMKTSRFPKEEHDCSIVLYSTQELYPRLKIVPAKRGVAFYAVFNSDKHVSAWEILSHNTSLSYMREDTKPSKEPCLDPCEQFLSINFRLKRYSPLYTTTFVIPAVASSIVLLTSFLLDTWNLRLLCAGTSLLMQATHTKFLASNLPPLSGPLPNIVKFYDANLILALLLILVAVLLTSLRQSNVLVPIGAQSLARLVNEYTISRALSFLLIRLKQQCIVLKKGFHDLFPILNEDLEEHEKVEPECDIREEHDVICDKKVPVTKRENDGKEQLVEVVEALHTVNMWIYLIVYASLAIIWLN